MKREIQYLLKSLSLKMKIKSLIIIFLLLNQILIGQNNSIESDCSSQRISIGLYTPGDSTNSKAKELNDIEIPFWDKYDFLDKDKYFILISKPQTGRDEYSEIFDYYRGNDYYEVRDINILRTIQKTYSQSTTVFNHQCESEKRSFLRLYKDKKFLESATLYLDCNILETKCGPINFNPRIFANNTNEITTEEEKKIFKSKDEFEKAIKEALLDESVLSMFDYKIFLGKFQYVFEDSLDKVNRIISSEFYYDVAKRKIAQQKNNRVSEIELDEKGKILEMLMRDQLSNIEYNLEEWEISKDNPDNFIITVSYTDEFQHLNFELIKKWEESKYILDLTKKNK